MHSYIRAAALSAVALAATQAASAGFVYQSAAREVAVSVNGSVVDSESNAAFGGWFGSASSGNSAFSALATQGSGLSYGEMSFVGASQIDASGDTALVNASSIATVVFTADSTESIRWIANLFRDSVGTGNSASIALSVVDAVSGNILLAFTGPSIGSGSFDVQAGRSYRVNLAALSIADGPSNSLSNYNVGFFSAVPTPGAVALLGLAGLAGRRRR
jgi:hypothetical protein